MNRLGRAAVVTALLAAVVPASIAEPAAARAAVDRVSGADVPTVAQVARPYPHFRGGGRDLMRGGRVQIPTPDCVGYGFARPRPTSSKLASYTMRGGGWAYFRGLADPVVGVYRFSSRADARDTLDKVRATTQRCLGTHADQGLRVTRSSFWVSPIGGARYAVREVSRDPYTGRDWFAEMWVLNGHQLVYVRAQKDREPPATKPLITLTRVALQAAD